MREVSVVGGSGYAGGELVRLLLDHPDQVLAGVDLTDAEAAQLRGLTSESLDSLAIDLEHRAHRGEPPGTTDVPNG